MSTRTGAAGAINGVTTVGAAIDATTTGVKLTYTCPAGKQARVSFASIAKLVGAITVAVEAVVGGVTVVIDSLTVQAQLGCSIYLNAADKVQLDVTTAVAVTGAFDGAISAEEYGTV